MGKSSIKKVLFLIFTITNIFMYAGGVYAMDESVPYKNNNLQDNKDVNESLYKIDEESFAGIDKIIYEEDKDLSLSKNDINNSYEEAESNGEHLGEPIDFFIPSENIFANKTIVDKNNSINVEHNIVSQAISAYNQILQQFCFNKKSNKSFSTQFYRYLNRSFMHALSVLTSDISYVQKTNNYNNFEELENNVQLNTGKVLDLYFQLIDITSNYIVTQNILSQRVSKMWETFVRICRATLINLSYKVRSSVKDKLTSVFANVVIPKCFDVGLFISSIIKKYDLDKSDSVSILNYKSWFKLVHDTDWYYFLSFCYTKAEEMCMWNSFFNITKIYNNNVFLFRSNIVLQRLQKTIIQMKHELLKYNIQISCKNKIYFDYRDAVFGIVPKSKICTPLYIIINALNYASISMKFVNTVEDVKTKDNYTNKINDTSRNSREASNI